MSEELKPCPFCGNKFPAVGYDSDMRALERPECITARCRQCGAETRKFSAPDWAVHAWNTRAESAEAERDAYRAVLEGAEYKGINNIGKQDPDLNRMLGQEVKRLTIMQMQEADAKLEKAKAALAFIESELKEHGYDISGPMRRTARDALKELDA